MLIKKEIPQGGIILEEKPFVYTLCSRFRTARCDFCFKNGELLKCSSCQYVYYCGRACQKEGWSVHKLECQYLKKIFPRILPDAARILARLIKILEKGGDRVKSYYTEKDYRLFKNLMSHYPNLKNDQSRMEHFSSLYGVLYEFFDEILPNSAELMGMYGRMCVNSFSICNQEFHSIGTGIYLAASVVDHSCQPNAVVTFEGTTLVMRALEKLPSLNWSKIFISYIDVMALKSERQAELEKTYYFLCQCPKCLEPEPIIEMTGAACPNLKCDNCIDSMNMAPGQTCQKCNEVITKEFIENFKEVIDITNMHLDNMKEKTLDLDVCNVCLNKHKGALYRYNVKHVKMLDLAFDSSIEFQKFDQATKHGLELIKSFYDYYGKIHPMTGLLHLKLGKLLNFQNDTKPAFEHLEKAKEILQITHGTGSSIFREHVIPLFQQFVMDSR
ncbi:unnamed protein product [Phaedon cochleariae]|uniref:MYND-type domain-containing protein n=1 Tax=Phaedon cochleariae TaxID=80249 RepID=A0A9P0DML1_PHACE|nr:unnamed protein product [Phaedon cochleariae]